MNNGLRYSFIRQVVYRKKWHTLLCH